MSREQGHQGEIFEVMEAVSYPTQLGEAVVTRYSALGDHELMLATREGDETAFHELVQRYRTPITNYVHRMINDYDMAVDLAQETFVRIFVSANRYRANHSFSTYIYRIATNLAISELRRRKRWKMVSLVSFFAPKDGDDPGDADLELPDQRPLVEAEMLQEERKQLVRRAVASLPEKYRSALVLRDIEELEYEQIADILGLPIGTVKSRINRARNLLREKLSAHL
jgi:RNA polymerase sigma-70 factor (ECF subfamily)